MVGFLHAALQLRLVTFRLAVPVEWGEACAAPCCDHWHGRRRLNGRIVKLERVWVGPRDGVEVVPLCSFHLRRHLLSERKNGGR
jgi:hypothetical protein